MSVTKQKAFALTYDLLYKGSVGRNNLMALVFSEERTGIKDKQLRAVLKENQIDLRYIKLNIMRKFLKNKEVNGLNNRVAILFIKDLINLPSTMKFLEDNNLIFIDSFYKNYRLKLSFLKKRSKPLISFKHLVENPIYLIKKMITNILVINKKINDNK